MKNEKNKNKCLSILKDWVEQLQKVITFGEDGSTLFNRREKSFDFRIKAPEANEVLLAGDFNSWDPIGIKMEKDEQGVWSASVKLNSGRYQYKFIVDGEWIIDPENESIAASECGSVNSVRQLTV